MITIKLINKSNNPNPVHEIGNAGFDIRANLTEPITLLPGERKLIPTGLYSVIPEGYYVQIHDRSGLALKQGIHTMAGVIDSSYRGEWGIVLINLGKDPFVINPGDRIAQGVTHEVIQTFFTQIVDFDENDASDRGTKGFGASGVK